MFTVSWELADGASGQIDVPEEARFLFGREQATVTADLPGLSRQALSIRDAGFGPVLFRGQRDNGARVAVVSNDGWREWIEPQSAMNLLPQASRVEFYLADQLVFSADVRHDERPRPSDHALPETTY
ncbi:MAG: hypothetical protein QM621_00380 [Aeromicrobium sp.]|uniref:hypothetical protein n=1 Tax=Aeromicrobium sp. TaxID=1871063 RepID=UPI0039E436E0